MRAAFAFLVGTTLAAASALAQDGDVLEFERHADARRGECDSIFGAGVGVDVAQHVNLRAEYEVVEIDRLEDPGAVWGAAERRF